LTRKIQNHFNCTICPKATDNEDASDIWLMSHFFGNCKSKPKLKKTFEEKKNVFEA
jgi:hypothetical protein